MVKKVVEKLGRISMVWSFLALVPALAWASEATAEVPVPVGDGTAWWVWPLVLLVVTFIMEIIAVLGGVGGGVLFVPIISGFFPLRTEHNEGKDEDYDDFLHSQGAHMTAFRHTAASSKV